MAEGKTMAEEHRVSMRSVSTDVELTTAELQFKFRATVPADPAPLRQMLPLVRALSNAVVDGTTRVLAEHGQPISCRAGCGACCRQLVAIGEIEAYHLHDLVRALPEPRRSEVLSRFAQARQRLQEAGLLQSLLCPEKWTKEESEQIKMMYFRLGISCPFLEEESCSIYSDRPIICREFLVTSPAENCLCPTPETVRGVKLPLQLVTVVARFMPELDPPQFVLPVALILALDWADDHVDVSPLRTGLEWLRAILDRLRTCEEGISRPQSDGMVTPPPETG
jgi:Fe-S-cluster containining protein